MKNIIGLFIICLLATSLKAQNIEKKNIKSVSKRQIEIDTREIEQFEEQHKVFFEAIESGNQRQIEATKQMIQETMRREIEQSKAVVEEPSPETAEKIRPKTKLQPRMVNETERREAESNRRSQAAQEYMKSRNIQQPVAAKKTKRKTTDTERSKSQHAIYQMFLSLEVDADNQFSVARMNKLLLSFSETLEQDLEEKKKLLSDQR